MKTLFKSTFALSLIILAAACGKKVGPTASGANPLPNATIINPGSMRTDGGSFTGTGSVVVNEPLAGTTSKQSYALTFRLEDGGSLTLHSNSTNRLENAVKLRFQRNAGTLAAKIVVGDTETDVSEAFAKLDAAGELQLQVDVHNDETPAHILAWSGADFSAGAAILNTEEGPGNGKGQFWGLELAQASVTRAVVSEPKFKE